MGSLGWMGSTSTKQLVGHSKKQEEFVFPKMADLSKMAAAQREGLMKCMWKVMLIVIWSFKLVLQDQV